MTTSPDDPWSCRFCGTSFDGCEQAPNPCCVGCLDAPDGGHLIDAPRRAPQLGVAQSTEGRATDVDEDKSAPYRRLGETFPPHYSDLCDVCSRAAAVGFGSPVRWLCAEHFEQEFPPMPRPLNPAPNAP